MEAPNRSRCRPRLNPLRRERLRRRHRHVRSEEGETTLLLDGNKLRTEGLGPNHSGIMIYDGDMQVMSMLDVEAKTYTEMTPASTKAQMGAVHDQMKNKTAGMTPEQRAQMKAAMSRMDPKRMEAIMGGQDRSPQAAAPKKTFEKTGKQQTVAGFPCAGYRQLSGGRVEAQGCLIPWSKGAVSKADLGSMEKLQAFIQEGARGMMGGNPFVQIGDMPGMPREWAMLEEGVYPCTSARSTWPRATRR